MSFSSRSGCRATTIVLTFSLSKRLTLKFLYFSYYDPFNPRFVNLKKEKVHLLDLSVHVEGERLFTGRLSYVLLSDTY